MSKKAPPKKEDKPAAAPKEEAKPAQRLKQRQNPRKPRKAKHEKSTEKKKEFAQCTKLKITSLVGHAQHVNDAEQDTSWQTTTTGTLAVTAALLVTNRNKQF